LVAIAAFVAMTAVVHCVLPDINEVPEQFSAILLWRFRIASLGLQAVLWAALGIIFGILAEPVLRARRRPSSVADAALSPSSASAGRQPES
jgi:hypothetical protein